VRRPSIILVLSMPRLRSLPKEWDHVDLIVLGLALFAVVGIIVGLALCVYEFVNKGVVRAAKTVQ
jgi:ABC-type proline/glycine betaine transport system permease subunit